MSNFIFANNVNTHLAAAAASTDTTLTLASSAGLPTLADGQLMPLTLKDETTGSIYETVYVSAISGAALTVTRAQEGTVAQAWNIGDYAFCAPTAGTLAPVNGSTSNRFSVAAAVAATDAPQAAQVPGLRQAWRDVTNSRSLATIYTNATAAEIKVSVIAGAAAQANAQLAGYVNGMKIWLSTGAAIVGGAVGLLLTVPAGGTYQVAADNYDLNLASWFEERT